MKYFPISAAFFAVLILSFSCGNSNPQDGAKTKAQTIAIDIDVATFDKMIVEKPGTILDVRTQDEYNRGFIDGSTLIDWYSDDFNQEVEQLDKNKPVYVYCHVGGRSKSAMKRLNSLGFTEVYNLNGGIVAWRNVHK